MSLKTGNSRRVAKSRPVCMGLNANVYKICKFCQENSNLPFAVPGNVKLKIREFKLHVSGNGKRQIRIFLAKFSLNVFVSYFLSGVERIIVYFSFGTAS
jgi:hypothetical protein